MLCEVNFCEFHKKIFNFLSHYAMKARDRSTNVFHRNNEFISNDDKTFSSQKNFY